MQLKNEHYEAIVNAALLAINNEIENLHRMEVDGIQLSQARIEITKNLKKPISFRSLFNNNVLEFCSPK